MSKYLKKFDNHSQYAAYTADTTNFILPNVSVCVQENDVHYNPYVDPYAGHDYVEIGGLKWATMNIGATAVTDTGLYFQWGDTQGYTADQVGSGEGQKYFGWADYKYCDGTSSNMTKYNSTDGKTILDLSDDAARTNWGGNWRMPTIDEFNELLTASTITKEWTSISGINGYRFSLIDDPTKYLFFPAAGRCFNGSVSRVGENGYYWSSLPKLDNLNNGCRFDFNNNDYHSNLGYNRCSGFPVRGVVSQ